MPNITIRTIHGIYARPSNRLESLGCLIGGCMPDARVEHFHYGYESPLGAVLRNKQHAQKLAATERLDALRPSRKEVWLTHSNGAAVSYLAVKKYGATPNMVVNINPALDRWRTPDVRQVLTIYSEQDIVTDLAQWVPFNVWGDQGRVGYRGRKSNTSSVNASDFPPGMRYRGHRGMFDPTRNQAWAVYLAAFIKALFEEGNNND